MKVIILIASMAFSVSVIAADASSAADLVNVTNMLNPLSNKYVQVTDLKVSNNTEANPSFIQTVIENEMPHSHQLASGHATPSRNQTN